MCMPVLPMLYIYGSFPAELSVTIYHFIVRNFYGICFTDFYAGHINEPDDEKVGI